MNNKRIFTIFVVAIVAFGCAFLGAIGGTALTLNLIGSPGQNQTTSLPVVSTEQNSQTIIVDNTKIETTITDVVNQVEPAVVTVVGTIGGTVTFFGVTPDQEVSGSGVIISNEGYIITNNHVVENTKSLSVIFHDGSEKPANLINRDVFGDLAVLKIEGEVPGVAKFGNSDNLQPGETVIAIGSPLGTFRNSVTVGVVSATDRLLDTGNGYTMEGLIQTDAAINQGNSGGPLLNLAGEVIGINTLVIRGSGVSSTNAEALGFAVPSNTAIMISDQIIQKGYFARPTLGADYEIITPRMASWYNLPVEWGAYLTQVSTNGPAGKAGMRKGDIITQVGDYALDENTSFVNALFEYEPNQTISVTFMRGDREIQADVTLGEISYN